MRLEEYDGTDSLNMILTFMNKEFKLNTKVCCLKDGTIIMPVIKDKETILTPEDIENIQLNRVTLTGVIYYNNIRLKLVTLGEELLYEINTDYTIDKVNRRNAYRVFLGECKDMTVYNNNRGYNVKCIVRDLSSTGVSVITREDIELDTKISLIINLSSNDALRIDGVIIREQELDKGNKLYGITLSKRYEKVDRYITSKQLKELRKRNK